MSVPHFGVLAARPLFLPVHIRPFVFGERAFELGGHWDQPWGLASPGVHAKPQRDVSRYLNHIFWAVLANATSIVHLFLFGELREFCLGDSCSVLPP